MSYCTLRQKEDRVNKVVLVATLIVATILVMWGSIALMVAI